MAEVLQFGLDFRDQIRAVRDRLTEDTNLIRFDNAFYRICRASDRPFGLRLLPSNGDVSEAVECLIRPRDLYVTEIGGKPFSRYASTLCTQPADIGTLDSALSAVRKGRDRKLFELQSRVVFCVAESLRNDHVASEISRRFDAAIMGVRGQDSLLPVARLWEEVHSYGDASDAVFRALSPDAQRIAHKTAHKGRAGLLPEERQFFERVVEERISANFRHLARRIKVLKCPRSATEP